MPTNTAKDLNLKIDTKALKGLYKTEPLRHAGGILFNWIIIVAAISLCYFFFNPFLYILTILIVGARMHALAILMHDATHYRFLKNRKQSDLITNLLCMYPIFSSIEQYRDNHLRHHRHLNTEDDPDWFVKLGKKEFTFPKTKSEFLLTVLSYFTLVQGLRDAMWFLKRFGGESKVKDKSLKNKLPRIIFYVVLFTCLTVFGGWKLFLFYWVIPYFSTFFMFQYVRSVAEHFGEMEYENLLNSTRTTKVNLIEQFFFAPHNVGYHLEHHLYPGVPYYHLPKLHELLQQSEAFREEAHITQGYWKGLMNELGTFTKAQASLTRVS